ncbi:mitochondrial chaperone BCS1 [Histoplasma capsulatum G186AR]|uniref:Mitochondrial chaperone BCS1 n=2 Tax=Ajellomyces capsulatus TaxID=5037 RepID=C0NW15_AJECG|nr:mitochondrial chaperone BCS1 [Histoplasma capsulatum G186AR]EEH04120.1 mitochondrial chaperone BCS1 [Histoplasma capsulatum G186AR]KAG5299013.1 mitochondrial chaperone BCS1 [Histoplasma capsulatum]QSS68368.1 mitochondrial chaperone BCS1 [Histoplasma capsulatum G186AR]
MSGNDADRGISKGMEVTGPALAQPTNHNDLIVPAKAQQQLSNLSSDVGLFSQLASNPFFTAGFGLAGLGAGLTLAQRGLRHGAALLRRRMLVEVEINIKDDSYGWFLHWMTLYQRSQLQKAPAASKSGFVDSLLRRLTPGMRQLSIQTQKVEHPNGAMHTQFALIPGPGKHVLRYKNAFIFVNRVREAKSRDHQTGRPWETVTLTTLYSQRRIFEDLFKEAHEYAARSQEGKTVIYNSWGTEWRQFGQSRRKRPLESVILDKGVKERIVDDVKDFLQSGSWYYDRGIPYRRGYLLHGPPGSGKSSFIQALAGELDYDIAILNLSERGLTDDRLNHLLTIIPARTLVLLEDVDAAFGNRRVQSDADGYRGANVTFSGLLNALDGVASAEERIIFLTTNHVERLDEALVRPGRVDMTVRLGETTRYQVSKLWERFYGDFDKTGFYQAQFLDKLHKLGVIEDENGHKIPAERATSAAALQGLFLYNKGDMEGAIRMAEGLVSEE